MKCMYFYRTDIANAGRKSTLILNFALNYRKNLNQKCDANTLSTALPPMTGHLIKINKSISDSRNDALAGFPKGVWIEPMVFLSHACRLRCRFSKLARR